jgi:hypothetical protein
MENAKCVQDNSIYSAAQFGELPRDIFLNIRHSLVCPECERPAFFRRESHNGRDSCFGARPHAHGCQQRTAPPTMNTREPGGNTRFPSPDEEIVVDLSYGSPDPIGGSHACGVNDITDPDDEFAELERYARMETAQASVRHMRLRPLLRLVLTNPDFCLSNHIINFPGIGRVRARDFLMPLEALRTEHQGRALCVFGRIRHAQHLDAHQCVWLFSQGYYAPNIKVPACEVIDLVNRYNTTNIGFLTDSYVMAIGEVKVSSSGNVYFYASDQRRMVVDNGASF